jgi:hypothetical protein
VFHRRVTPHRVVAVVLHRVMAVVLHRVMAVVLHRVVAHRDGLSSWREGRGGGQDGCDGRTGARGVQRTDEKAHVGLLDLI